MALFSCLYTLQTYIFSNNFSKFIHCCLSAYDYGCIILKTVAIIWYFIV